MWSTPDLVVVGRHTYSLLPGPYFEVCTVEVKRVEGWTLASIHEAVAHGRFATRAYALFMIPNGFDVDDDAFEVCRARRCGSG